MKNFVTSPESHTEGTYQSRVGCIPGENRPKPTYDERMTSYGITVNHSEEPYRGPGKSTSYEVPHKSDLYRKSKKHSQH